MFKDNFVLAIKTSGGEVLRESGGSVYLPFDSEYKIFLKNSNFRRVAVKVRIDGTEVTNGSIILNAFQDVDLERFIVDGNLEAGKKFKFVSISDPAVQDPTNSKNGIVEVEFRLEKDVSKWNVTYFPSFIYHNIPTFKSTTEGFTSNFCCSLSSAESFAASVNNMRGATIEGEQSNQKFVPVTIGELGEPIVLSLQILAPLSSTQPITVSDTRYKYCSSCGKKLKYNDRYCSECGMKQ